MVVHRQIPWVGLSWGRWTLEDPEEGRRATEHARKNKNTRARTQVQGSPAEIKPLLLLLRCIAICGYVLQRLLELYVRSLLNLARGGRELTDER